MGTTTSHRDDTECKFSEILMRAARHLLHAHDHAARDSNAPGDRVRTIRGYVAALRV